MGVQYFSINCDNNNNNNKNNKNDVVGDVERQLTNLPARQEDDITPPLLSASKILLRCINLYDVRLLLRPYAMQFGELREVGESL